MIPSTIGSKGQGFFSSKVSDTNMQSQPLTIYANSFIITSATNTIDNSANSIRVTEDQLHDFWHTISQVNYFSERREEFYITLVKNLLKKVEFLQLVQQLSEKLMTEEEFEDELQNNQDRYVIDTEDLEDPSDLIIVSNIVNKLVRLFDIDEIAELFSLDVNSINDKLKFFPQSFNEISS